MMKIQIDPIFPHNEAALAEYDELCKQGGIKRDSSLERILAARDESGRMVAAGGVSGKTLRSLVTLPGLQGEGIMAQLLGSLLYLQRERGHHQVFIFSKAKYKSLYESLGFHVIAEIPSGTIMLENSSRRFQDWLNQIKKDSQEIIQERGLDAQAESAALVMNCNPMTLGHLSLVRWTAERYPITHLFILEEDVSFFSYKERRTIVEESTRDLPGVILHGSSDYLISRASFPAYFLRSMDEAAEQQAILDAGIFKKIADSLGIHCRVLGDEPFLELGKRYNEILREELTSADLQVEILPRWKDESGEVISATRVRSLIKAGEWEEARKLTPPAGHRFINPEYLGERVSSCL